MVKSRSGNSTPCSLARLSIGNAVPLLSLITLSLTLLEFCRKRFGESQEKATIEFLVFPRRIYVWSVRFIVLLYLLANVDNDFD